MKKKTGTWKKLTAICLTFLMAVGMLGLTVFAAPIADKTGTITVSGVEDGVTVTAYQVLDVNFDYTNQQPLDPEYTWNAGVKDWVRQNYSTYIGTDDSVTEAFSKAGTDDVAAFYDRMAAAVKGTGITLNPAGNCQGNGTISGLSMGGYLLIIENGMKIYRPSVVNVVPEHKDDAWAMTSPVVTVKSSEPTIDKKVNEDDTADSHNPDVSDSGAIGDVFNFDLRADVPQYPANAIAKGYVISDTLPAGLSLVTGSVAVYGVNNAGETLLGEGEGQAYKLGTARPDNKGAVTFSLTFDYDKIKDYTKIHVDYNAKLTANAVVGPNGNVNDAVLDYNNNPYDASSWKEKTDEVTIYTYGLKVEKKNNAQEFLPEAEFTLSRNENGSDAMYFVKTADGEYRVAESTESGATQTLVVGESDPAKGTLKISGLAKADRLYLTETKAPGGYNKPSIPVQLEIKDTDNNGKPTNGGSAEYADGYVAIEVINTQGFQLPVTGGMGTILFTACGIVVMGGAILLFFALRRRKTM